MTNKPRLQPAPLPRYTGTEPCTRFPVDMFFPGTARHPRDYSYPKAVCFSCRVRNECLAYALTNDVKGVWGGTTDKDRAVIRQAMGAVPHIVDLREEATLRYRIDELDDGTRSSNDIARELRCSARTVDRRRSARSRGEAA